MPDFQRFFIGFNGLITGALVAAVLLFVAIQPMSKANVGQKLELLHVSFDPTREVIHEINNSFSEHLKALKGLNVNILQSHGGSGSQARAVVDGLQADIASLALWTDIEILGRKELLHKGWESYRGIEHPPWATAIVFLVRNGNPKKIKDWDDLTRNDISIITPNPKISGNGRLVFLSAWGYSLQKGDSLEKAAEFLQGIYKNVPVMDASARASQVTFFQKKIGDVQLAFESEALMAVKESKGELQIVYPSVSIRVSPPISVVDKNVDARSTREVAELYLGYFYSKDAQRIIAKQGYRPMDHEVFKEFENSFPAMTFFDVSLVGKNWTDVQQGFFGEDGIFDQVFKRIRRDSK